MGFAGKSIKRETLGWKSASMAIFSMLPIYEVRQGFNYLPPFPLTTFVRIDKNLTPIIVPDEIMTPLSQLWHLKVMQFFLCDQIKHFSLFHSSFSSFHVTSSHDLRLPCEILRFHISRVFTPFNLKNLDDRSCEMAYLYRRSESLWIWWTRSVPQTTLATHRLIGAYLSLRPCFPYAPGLWSWA